MKIGIDCRIFSSSFTGIGRYTFELVKNLLEINKEQNYPHEFVLFFNESEYKDFEEQSHCKKVLVNARHYSLSEQFHFCKKLYKENLDLTFFPHFNVPLFYRRKYVVTIHDLTLSLFKGRKMTRFYHRLFYQIIIGNAVRSAQKIISVSENTKNDVVKFLKAKGEKIKVIYHGIGAEFTLIKDADNFKKTLEKFQIKKQFLLYTGVWRSHKNLPRLIEAFSILKKELDLNLVITGNPDPLYPEVKEAVKSFALEKDVIFTGHVSEKELVDLYNAAMIFVFPSLYEGFGFPPLEAMKCGTPVACSKASSLPEICGDAAIYFDPYDVSDIAKKITDLYKNTDLQIEMEEKGLKHVEKFSWQKCARETYNLLS